ncbi:MAG: DUF3035 domain-containing protein, partial [Rhodospirillales bacterium]|nr:DUF3035 domain-containing protein [Rhodospirillales bacterium]
MFTRNSLFILAVLGAAVFLSSCEETKRALGQSKSSPDEFAVYQRAPLSLPRDYSLRPPAPGSERPQSVNPRDKVSKMLGQPRTTETPAQDGTVDLKGMSPGEISLLRVTGGIDAPASIRTQINRESAI